MSNNTTTNQTSPFQLFPTLNPATYEALRASIQRFGVLVPVAVDQDGQIIDGHHRHKIATELGVDTPTITHTITDVEHGEELAATLNLARRHLDPEQRREIVKHLLLDVDEHGVGKHSPNAIADAVGVDRRQVDRDQAQLAHMRKLDPAELPESRRGLDGKIRPATRPTTTPDVVDGHEIVERIPLDGEQAEMLVDTAGDYTIQETPEPEPEPNYPRKPDLGNGVSHPARYTTGLTDLFAELIASNMPSAETVLDPFAGTGRIHELHDHYGYETIGIELEPEWANMHPRTRQGDALKLGMEPRTIDVICTSPTYGNRLADKHNASDPERRRSYTHDLGRPLTDNNSGGMQWGDEYREFHKLAWVESNWVLKPGGLFIINIKDHIRAGCRQPVVAWHAQAMTGLGYELVDFAAFGAPGLKQGDNAAARVDFEIVWVFRKAE